MHWHDMLLENLVESRDADDLKNYVDSLCIEQ